MPMIIASETLCLLFGGFVERGPTSSETSPYLRDLLARFVDIIYLIVSQLQ